MNAQVQEVTPDAESPPAVPGTIYVAVLETEGFIVGGDNEPSGVYRRDTNGVWTHLGWKNIRCADVTISPHDGTTLYLGAGNGIFRSRDGGETWRQLNRWDVTEVQEVALDPFRPGCIMIATAYGPFRSYDDGARWTLCVDGIPTPQSSFTQVAAFDHANQGSVIVGTEGGLYRSDDRGERWHAIGPRVPVRDLKQSPVAPELWLAATDGFGVLRSLDGGAEWIRVDGDFAEDTIWAVALDSSSPERVAAGGYGTGVHVSQNRGATWRLHSASGGQEQVHALAYDPFVVGRLWVGRVRDGVAFADDEAPRWSDGGLGGATVWELIVVGGDR